MSQAVKIMDIAKDARVSMDLEREDFIRKTIKGEPRNCVPVCHSVKITNDNLKKVRSGDKKSEVRKNDRFYIEGDFLLMHEVNGKGNLTGYTVLTEIKHIETFAQENDYVVLSLEIIKAW